DEGKRPDGTDRKRVRVSVTITLPVGRNEAVPVFANQEIRKKAWRALLGDPVPWQRDHERPQHTKNPRQTAPDVEPAAVVYRPKEQRRPRSAQGPGSLRE